MFLDFVSRCINLENYTLIWPQRASRRNPLSDLSHMFSATLRRLVAAAPPPASPQRLWPRAHGALRWRLEYRASSEASLGWRALLRANANVLGHLRHEGESIQGGLVDTSHLVVHQVGKQAQGTNVSFSLPANASAQGPSVATDKRTRDRQTGDWQDQVDQWQEDRRNGRKLVG